jgi:hypothetical protein
VITPHGFSSSWLLLALPQKSRLLSDASSHQDGIWPRCTWIQARLCTKTTDAVGGLFISLDLMPQPPDSSWSEQSTNYVGGIPQ